MKTEGFLAGWLGSGREGLVGNPQDPADRPYRIFLSSTEKLQQIIRSQERIHAPCWLSTNSFKKLGEPAFFERVYFDFDSPEDLALAKKEAFMLKRRLKDAYGVEALVCFSGSKGYNVYAFLQEPVPITDAEFFKKLQSVMIKDILKSWSSTVDSPLHTDIMRLSRIPYTRHNGSGKFCLPQEENGEVLLLNGIEKFVDSGLSDEFVQQEIRKTERILKHEKLCRRTPAQIEGSMKIRPCIEKALKTNLEGGSGHLMRIAAAREYLNAGFSEEAAAKLFAGQKDYSFAKSLQKVQQLNRKTMKPVRCSKIAELGFCLGERCRKT